MRNPRFSHQHCQVHTAYVMYCTFFCFQDCIGSEACELLRSDSVDSGGPSSSTDKTVDGISSGLMQIVGGFATPKDSVL